MKVSDMFPSKYLSASDLRGREVAVTIARIADDKMRDPKTGREISKPVVYFERKKKGMVLNKTNAFTIAEILGEEDTDKWIGREIVLVPSQTMVAGTEKDCIRVRAVLDDNDGAAK